VTILSVQPEATSPAKGRVDFAVLAGPGPPLALAQQLLEDVRERLAALHGDVPVRVEVIEDAALAQPAPTVEIVEHLRRRLLDGGWELVLGLTDLPLSLGRRPVAGHASPTHGVAVLSLPALGATRTTQRARTAVGRLIDEVLGEEADEPADIGRTRRLRRRLARLRDVGDERGGYATVLTGGYLTLLAGLVRSNEPWRFALRLSRALVAALAAVAFALVTPDLWRIADQLGPVRLCALTFASIAGSAVTFVVAHDLWERTATPSARAQVALFNLATAATVVLGVATLYLALFGVTVATALLLLPPSLLTETLGHQATAADYLRLSWLISSLATVGGGLGGGLETDASVREATYASDADDDA
jgi:hypothetical protein